VKLLPLIGIILAGKKLFQMVPIAGMIFGAFINRSSIVDVAETGMMLYRKRRIVEPINQLEKLQGNLTSEN